MKIIIKNFGPIINFELNVKKLMIFVGRNNAGKSYASLLLEVINSSFIDFIDQIYDFYGIYKYLNSSIFIDDSDFSFIVNKNNNIDDLEPNTDQFQFNYEQIIKSIKKEDIDKLISDIENKIANLAAPFRSKIKIPRGIQEIAYKHLNKKISEILTIIFSKKLINKFSSNIQDLINFNASKAEIIIDHHDMNILFTLRKENGHKVDIIFKLLNRDTLFSKMRLKLKKIENELRLYSKITQKEKVKNTIIKEIIYFTLETVIKDIIKYIKNIIDKNFFNTLYLPATRSGLIQAYETIATAYIQLAPESITRKIDFPTLSGISADYIKNLFKSESHELIIPYYYKKKKNFIKKIIDFLEKEIIYGKIEFKKKNGKEIKGYILYNVKGNEIPLYRASSMISELSSLILFLKKLIKPGDLLIFEEPESHLHPESIIKIAKLITLLYKNRIRLIITTHSDYFLHQINNFVKLNRLPSQKIIEILGEDLSIPIDDISINLFKHDDYKNTTFVKDLKFDNFGLTEDVFYEITEELFQESTKIDELINNELKS
ncbi:MAG: AAA family ATPase [Promethearchaeota archaeon]